MKKLILIFGVFAIICVIISAYVQPSAQIKEEQITQTQSTQSTDADSYLIKSENGRIVVYKNNELHYKTTTAVSTLPKIDQKTLLYGIQAQTKEEVEEILLQYCS